MTKLVGPLSAAGGALAAFFLDPASGRRRRAQLVQQVSGFFRRRGRQARRLSRAAGAEAYGLAQRAAHLRPEPKDLNDPELAHKVETEIFRDAHVPKGRINVSAHDGIVALRGEVERPELIEELVEKARRVPEVREVENLLHLPGTQAPTHA